MPVSRPRRRVAHRYAACTSSQPIACSHSSLQVGNGRRQEGGSQHHGGNGEKRLSIHLVLLQCAANASLNVNSLADLIALARSAPGTIAYATSGIGTAQHVAMTVLAQRAGVTFPHVSYTNSGRLIADVLSCLVPIAAFFPGTIEPHRKAGRLKALAVTGARRALAWPDARTIAESGFPDFDALSWVGVLAPAGTPPEIIGCLHSRRLRVPV